MLATLSIQIQDTSILPNPNVMKLKAINRMTECFAGNARRNCQINDLKTLVLNEVVGEVFCSTGTVMSQKIIHQRHVPSKNLFLEWSEYQLRHNVTLEEKNK